MNAATSGSKRCPGFVAAIVAVTFSVFASRAFAQRKQDSAKTSDEAPALVETTPDAPPVIFAKMPLEVARAEVLTWLATTGQDPDTLKKVTEKWADDQQLAEFSGEQLLDHVVNSFASVDKGTLKLVQDTYGHGPVEGMIYDGIRETPFFQNQVRQFHGRWLVQHRFYNNAMPLLGDLDPDAVVDPAGLLFYRALCQAELLKRKDALESLSLLLNNTLDVPDRFRVVAEMLQQELAGQKDDGMQVVGRLMKDVERRLELGDPGEDTQQQGKAVVDALDKLLEDMEKQKNKNPNGGGGAEGIPQNQSGRQAAEESRIKGSPADGIADRKNLKEEGNWGMLDRKAEAKARELIRRKLPANFLDQIGRFSRKLAEQKK